MNAYLVLTKLNGSLLNSGLKGAITESNSKSDFYFNLVQDYTTAWTGKKPSRQQGRGDTREGDKQHRNAQEGNKGQSNTQEKPNQAETSGADKSALHEWYELLFAQYYDRLSPSSAESYTCILSSLSALTIGQGQPSVLETHITLHPIYGVPYLPGTVLKGVAAHYCNRYLGQMDERFCSGGDYYNQLFGSTTQMGSICYHDALVTPETVGTALRLDVLTPHHQKYNQIRITKEQQVVSSDAAPHDDDSPVPIPFISVNADFKLQLTYIGMSAQAREWLDIAGEILTAAVQQEGLGGKTNAGYGRFKVK
ncbi:type III-B CRISPR module RAMP protein Cmr6 [Paenibacillus sp. NPDC057934]|uniref:type III-B CRISPR module RAMP protein Cmr6 n=1 Tax=Paenibacillus sp. NPDC057934 TaxID=3346282 RepID=UPI0036DB6D3E